MLARISTVLLIALLAASIAPGADYFVAPDGDDANPGTMAAPMKSPVEAARKLMPGDTLYFRAGTYTPDHSRHVALAPFRDGRAGEPITFAAWPDEHVVLNVSEKANGISNDGFSWCVFDGFEVVGGEYHCMKLAKGRNGGYGSDIVVRNCEMHSGNGPLLFAYGTPRITVENCHLHDSTRSHGLYLQRGCDASVIRHVTSENNRGNSGIQLNAAGQGISDCVLEFNLLRGNAHGFSLMAVQDTLFRRNVLYNNAVDGPRGSGWREIILWAGGQDVPCRDVSFVHNTIVNTRTENINQLIHLKERSSNVVLRNNILHIPHKRALTIEDDAAGGLVLEGNLWSASLGILFGDAFQVADLIDTFDEISGRDNLEGAPMMTDPEQADFCPRSGSPAIDAGARVESPSVPVVGDAPDIGAIEVGADQQPRIGCRLQ